MLVFIDRMVNGTLYNYGLQLNPQWTYPYQIYFDVGLAFIFVNAIAAGLLETTYPREGGEEPERVSPSGRKETVVSIPKVSSPPQIKEEKKETKPQSSESGPLKNELSVAHCRYCDFENEPDSVFCEKCGKFLGNLRPSVLTTHLFCRACGAKNRVTAEYCKKCGQPLNQ